MEWEQISDSNNTRVYRAKVFKGWIMETIVKGWSDHNDIITQVFIPDEHHEWEIGHE